VLDILEQCQRDKKAAKKFFIALLKRLRQNSRHDGKAEYVNSSQWVYAAAMSSINWINRA
jgi:hypothetical protein